jgi:hypothetical protein
MTPEEKARDLIIKFAFKGAQHEGEAKTFALIAVNEILNNFGLTANGQTFFTEHKAIQYYQEVKQEIEKL